MFDADSVFKTEEGKPAVKQGWTFAAAFFVAADERLNLDLRQVRKIESQDIARFSYQTTLN